MAINFYSEKLSTGEMLIWLLGRTDDDGSNKNTPFWKLDYVSRGTNDQGEEDIITLAPRKRVQSILQHHLNDSIANIHLDDRYSDVSTFASPRDCSSKKPIELLKHYQPLNKNRRTLMCTSLTGAKTGWALFMHGSFSCRCGPCQHKADLKRGKMFEQLYQRWKIRTSQCASKRLGQSFEWAKPQSSNCRSTSICHGIYSYRYLYI